jgi:hypothetical protein
LIAAAEVNLVPPHMRIESEYMMSTNPQYDMVADFLEDLAKFAGNESDRLQLLQVAARFRAIVQPLIIGREEPGDNALPRPA